MLATMLTTWALAVSSAAAPGGEWIELFDGRTLDGWSVHSGFAKYHVEEGVIVG